MPPLNFYLRFVELSYEVWALGEHLKVIEPQLQFLRDQGALHVAADLRERGVEGDDSERQLAYQEYWDRTDNILPRYFRGTFLIALWAVYESSVQEVADHHRVQKKLTRRMPKRGGSFPKRARDYFDREIQEVLDLKSGRLDRIDDLYVIRNALAHANGQLRWVAPDKLQELEGVLAKHPQLLVDDRFIVPTTEFLHVAYSDIDGSLRSLVDRAKPERFRVAADGEA